MNKSLFKLGLLFLLVCSFLTIEAQPELFQREKVFLHTDRMKYGAGETIFFSAYHYEPVDSQVEGSSEILYVDLITSQGEQIGNEQLKLVEGRASGSIDIDYDLTSQVITLRSYTNYMRNFDDIDFFRQQIEVVGSGPSPTNQDAAPKITIAAYPEGGDLINGVVSNVGIKLQNGKNGIEGEVELFQDGESVDFYETNEYGFGNIVFTPEEGSTYMLQYDDVSATLPKAKTQGLSIRTRTTTDLFTIYIAEKRVPDIALHTAMIISNDQVIYHEKLTDPILKLTKEKLPTGLLTIVILDPKNRPVCERLLFNHYDIDSEFLDIGIPEDAPTTRSLVEIPIDVYDIDGDPVMASMSAAVADHRYYGATPSIRSKWLLSSEVKGYIQNPEQYLVENSEEVIERTDLLLLTQGWRTYDWDESMTIEFPKQRDLPIRGRVVKPKKVNEGLKTYGSVSILDENFDILPLETDEDGYFTIADLDRSGELPLFFQMGTKKPKDETKIGGAAKGNTDVEILMQLTETHPATDNDLNPHYLPNAKVKKQTNYQVEALPDDEFYVDEGLLIDEVTIEAKKLDEWAEYYDDVIDYGSGSTDRVYTDEIVGIGNYDDIYDILRSRVTGIEITFPLSTNSTSRRDVIIRGFSTGLVEATRQNNAAKFLLNGSAVPAPTIEAINPIDIAFVDVIKSLNELAIYGEYGSGGIIAVYLKPPGARSNRRAPEIAKKSSGVYIDYQVYSVAKKFYTTTYGSDGSYEKEAIRRTVHWDPIIMTDDEGVAQLSFYTADYIGTYHIDVQGITSTGQPISQTVTFSVE